MADLSAFGVDRPAVRPRGPGKREGPAGTRVEVHRAGPGSFELRLSGRSRETGARWSQSHRVPRERVRALWDLLVRMDLDPIPRGEALRALLRGKGGHFQWLDPKEAKTGTWRASLYDPEFHFPMLVLEHFYRLVERVGRANIRIRRDAAGPL